MSKRTAALDRFWGKVQKGDSCWIWRGSISARGQVVFYADGSVRKAQRWIYGQTVEPLVENSWVLSTCDEPLCVRPDHLKQLATVEDRFWHKVEKTPTCWLWTGSTTEKGYGHLNAGDYTAAAHRFSYELLAGPIPDGLEIDHLCRVRNCVNPDHLEPVTGKVNMSRAVGDYPKLLAARTHCKSGHEYTPANTSRDKKGARVCKACASTYGKQYRARKKAQSAA